MSLNKVVRPLLAVFVLVLASLACALGGPPAIGEVVVAEGLTADYLPIGGPIDTYTSDDTVINISVEVQNLEVGTTVEVRYKLNGADYETLTSTANEAGSGYYGFTLTVDSGLLPGDYVADIYLNGQLAKSATFKVVASGPPSIAGAVTARSLDENYQPVNPTAVFGTSDTFYISVNVKNLVVGSDVTVKYTYEGEYASDADTTVVADQAGSGYYGFSLTPPPDGFPIGNYTAEVYLDGVLATTVAFSVQ